MTNQRLLKVLRELAGEAACVFLTCLIPFFLIVGSVLMGVSFAVWEMVPVTAIVFGLRLCIVAAAGMAVYYVFDSAGGDALRRIRRSL